MKKLVYWSLMGAALSVGCNHAEGMKRARLPKNEEVKSKVGTVVEQQVSDLQRDKQWLEIALKWETCKTKNLEGQRDLVQTLMKELTSQLREAQEKISCLEKELKNTQDKCAKLADELEQQKKMALDKENTSVKEN